METRGRDRREKSIPQKRKPSSPRRSDEGAQAKRLDDGQSRSVGTQVLDEQQGAGLLESGQATAGMAPETVSGIAATGNELLPIFDIASGEHQSSKINTIHAR